MNMSASSLTCFCSSLSWEGRPNDAIIMPFGPYGRRSGAIRTEFLNAIAYTLFRHTQVMDTKIHVVQATDRYVMDSYAEFEIVDQDNKTVRKVKSAT